MRTYDDGVKDGMRETFTAELEDAAMRIAILEEELDSNSDGMLTLEEPKLRQQSAVL